MPAPRRLISILERFGPLLALVLLILGTALVEHFTVTDPSNRAFLTLANFNNILGQWSFVGIVAIGMTFVIILGGIDLSVGSMVALAAGAAVFALNAVAGGTGPATQRTVQAIAAACAVALLGGALLGLINGIVISKGRIAPFVATLGTLAIYRSLVLAPAQGSLVSARVNEFSTIGSATISLPGLGNGGGPLALRVSILIFLACAVAAHVILTRTVFGRRIYAIGDNPQAARYAGVRIDRVTMGVYAIAGLCCGIAALLNASRMTSVDSSALGLFYELDAIAAVVIGGTRLQGGAGHVFGTVIGVLIMGVVGNMLNMLDVSNFYHGLVKGLIIIAAVLVQPRKL